MQTPVDIEQIVREVVRRLAEAPSIAPVTSTPADTGRVVALTGRVITTSSLPRDWANIDRIHVAPAAVVTPSVLDELRDRGVALVRQDLESGAACMPGSRFKLAIDKAIDDPACWNSFADRSEESTATGCLASLIERLSQDHWTEKDRCLLVTSRVAFAVCELNRHSAIRAFHAHHPNSLGEACRDLSPNVLVLHPRHRSRADELLPIFLGDALSTDARPAGIQPTLSHSLRTEGTA